MKPPFFFVAAAVLFAASEAPAQRRAPRPTDRRATPVATALPKTTPLPTPRPSPVPPPRIPQVQKGARPVTRVARFPSEELFFSRLLRVEEVDLDKDGIFEALVDGVGSIQKLPLGIPTVGVVSPFRLPFESPLLAVMQKNGEQWRTLAIAHLPLRCGQSDDFSTCDQLIAFRSIRFRFDDRPQVLLQIYHAGDGGLNETYAYRLNRGKLETTLEVSLPRFSVDVSVEPSGILRRLAVDTFANRDLPSRYRSFTLRSWFIFGENRFRVQSESIEEVWGERNELAYWGLVHQPGQNDDIERLRERERREPPDSWVHDPVEVVKKRYPDATQLRLGGKQPGVSIVYFERPGGCHGHAVLYQPVREWEGEKSLWEIAALRARKDLPYECLDEPPLSIAR